MIGATNNDNNGISTTLNNALDRIRFTPRQSADSAIVDRADDLFRDVQHSLLERLQGNISSGERAQLTEYLDQLEASWKNLSDRHSGAEARVNHHADFDYEYLTEHSNDLFGDFVTLAEATMANIDGTTAGNGGNSSGSSCENSGGLDFGLDSGPYSVNDHTNPEMQIVGDLGNNGSTEETTGSTVPNWLTDPSEALRLYEQDPGRFYEEWMNLDSEQQSFAMMSLQKEMQQHAQMTQLITNLLASMHSSAMAVARNLKA